MRIGLIGYGAWASKALARNVAKHATIAWVLDPSEAAVAKAVHDDVAPLGVIGGSFDRLTEANLTGRPIDMVDAIVIAAPISLHYYYARHALLAGKHVLCEKPLGTKAEDVTNLGRLAFGTLMASTPWNYHPAIQRAGIIARELGAPLWFRAARTSWDERPLDPIADLLPHDVGILRAWTGQEIAEVSATVEGPTASVTLRTTGGVLGTIQYTYRDREKQRRVELGCEGGLVRCDQMHPDEFPSFYGLQALRGESSWWLSDDEELKGPEPLDAMCAEFVACCREGRAPKYGNVDDALAVAKAIEAAHKSVSERRVVTL